MDRRTFLQLAGSGAAYWLASDSLPAQKSKSPENLIPLEKNLLSYEALTQLTGPEVFSGDDLRFIGMPVGGLCAGLVYLGGDGKLWEWDIFNRSTLAKRATYAGCSFTNLEGASYVEPFEQKSPFLQGFALSYKNGSKSGIRPLDKTGWKDITFEGTYPIGKVNFKNDSLGLLVELKAFSPFIPLSFEDSSLPATVMRYTLVNLSPDPVDISMAGWLENTVAGRGPSSEFKRVNKVISGAGYSGVQMSCEIALPAIDAPPCEVAKQGDFGTMALVILDPDSSLSVIPHAREGQPETIAFDTEDEQAFRPADTPNPLGTLNNRFTIPPGGTKTITFVIAWNFPNVDYRIQKETTHYYSKRFSRAQDVAAYVSDNFERLLLGTTRWCTTWNDSTLPRWFLNRTFASTSSLASTTCYRFANGQFWAWDSNYSTGGTATHVWLYAQAMARLFPEMERGLRTFTDFGFAQSEDDGVINCRGTHGGLAVDGQAGVILRTYREHLMCSDSGFLERLWPRVKLATQPLILYINSRGLIDGPQFNTLDSTWYGESAWLSGLFLAALSAAARMARILGDEDFASLANSYFEKGSASLVRTLFNGEYFFNRVDPAHPESINSGTGCEIDQLFGQSWAWQVGLPRVFSQQATLTALTSLFKYNFTPNAGLYLHKMGPGRWFAMPGEAGLLLCTFPKPDWQIKDAAGEGSPFEVGYFNECRTGFEHQVASHMIAEGMVHEGLSILKAIHDRYSPAKRNPYNEIDGGDHSSRAMASYGSFISISGFSYDGPQNRIGFSPRVNADDFKAAFTTAEGWGSYSQQFRDNSVTAALDLRWGKLKLKNWTIPRPSGFEAKDVDVRLGDVSVPADFLTGLSGVEIEFKKLLIVNQDEVLKVVLTPG